MKIDKTALRGPLPLPPPAEPAPAAAPIDALGPVRSGSTPPMPSDAELVALLQRLDQKPEAERPLRKRIAGNLRAFVGKLVDRAAALVKHGAEVVRSLGLAAFKATTKEDLLQLYDFVKMAKDAGQPSIVIEPILDVLGFIVKHPEEARKVLGFLDANRQETWQGKSAWMGLPAPAAVGEAGGGAPTKRADIVVIGSGLGAASIARHAAEIARINHAEAPSVLVLERDSKEARSHAASLRNAGIICTAMDYVFGIDEAIGDKPVDRIASALAIARPEAEKVYASLMAVMRDARAHIEAFLAEKGADVELSRSGTLDVAKTKDEVEALRVAAARASELGLDWRVVDAAALERDFGIQSDQIAGAIHFRDSGQLHPGKLVKALFDHAVAESDKIGIDYDTEVKNARPAPGGGWLLETSKGTIHAATVVDAREAFAPYAWREKRFSQIHVVKVEPGSEPTRLGDTNVCHSLTYMRSLGDGRFMVGSGDFPIHDATQPPAPLASVALYSAANFKKMFPNTPFELERVWGGVFGLNSDGIPVTGELADKWHVIGGSGGSGLNLTPVLAQQAVAEITGSGSKPLSPAADFGPRRFFVQALRHELLAELLARPGFEQTKIEDVEVEVLNDARPGSAKPPRVEGGKVRFQIEERALDQMNPDVLAITGGDAAAALRQREKLGAWVAVQAALAQR